MPFLIYIRVKIINFDFTSLILSLNLSLSINYDTKDKTFLNVHSESTKKIIVLNALLYLDLAS